ncbi:AAA family ATPase [Mesorhizobium sp. CA8]|nr:MULTISPECIES: AAA family ATPase [unclassified Mesorhizobium]MBZ9760249.1 AAA family ATPase [Mesorhizobium sp. CA8]MBZ9817878.1 AAA family ATPase [Mesorhizobium sp. CA4]
MIVEFVGPAGSGKTTFAHALYEQLRAHGHPARIVLTDRRAVHRTMLDPGGIVTAMGRVARAAARSIGMACRPSANAVDFRIRANLIHTLPPRNVIWRIRLSQYVLRLARAWRQSVTSEEILIFDEAFVQAVSMLACFSGTADETSLAHALDFIPESDVVVRIDASEQLLIERLDRRQKNHTFAERWFETGLDIRLQSAAVVARVCGLLTARGRLIIDVDANNQRSLTLAIDEIEEEILAKYKRSLHSVADPPIPSH